MRTAILIVTALKAELVLPGVLYSGVGKINATWSLSRWLRQNRPGLVVNYGTVGGLNSGVSGLVEVSRVIQADMMAEPLAPRGQTPFDDAPHVYESGQPGVVCASGDSFMTSVDPWLLDQGVHVVDMELFAIATVCHREGIPWRAFKFVSDYANEESGSDWQYNVHRGREAFLAVLRGI